MTYTHATTTEPKLAPPGAGIPFYQKIVLRLFVAPFIANRVPREEAHRNFEKIHQRIEKEIKNIPAELWNKKVLVPPQTGLEDSSRYWSIAMTVEHLLIVGRKISQGVHLLSHHQIPPGEANTATVKPLGGLNTDDLLRDFLKFRTEEFETLNREIGDYHAKETFRHPWFGPLNARQWYWLLAVHAGIHLKQIRAIRQQLL